MIFAHSCVPTVHFWLIKFTFSALKDTKRNELHKTVEVLHIGISLKFYAVMVDTVKLVFRIVY